MLCFLQKHLKPFSFINFMWHIYCLQTCTHEVKEYTEEENGNMRGSDLLALHETNTLNNELRQ